MAHPAEVNRNGALPPLLPAPAKSPAELELERIRTLSRDRSKRWRQNRQGGGVASGQPSQPDGAPPSPKGIGGAPPIHSTRPLDELGQGPEAYQRAAPPIADVEPLEPPDTEGAKKFGALVALVFKVALDDAVTRYDLASVLVELGGDASELDPAAVLAAKGAAVGFVYTHAERCALKHGLGFTLPWEDELVTLGAGAGSILYLAAKFTGRLERTERDPASPSHPAPRRAAPPFARKPPPPTADDGPDAESFGPLRVDSDGDADGYH